MTLAMKNHQIIDKLEPYKAWSLLSNDPIIVYLDYTDEYYTMWGGLLMPYETSMILLGARVLNTHISTIMHIQCGKKIESMMWNIFNDTHNFKYDNYQSLSRGYINYVVKMIEQNLIQFTKDHTPQEAVLYFDLNKSNSL